MSRPRPATTGDVTPATSGDGQTAASSSDEYLASIHQRVTDDAIARKVSHYLICDRLDTAHVCSVHMRNFCLEKLRRGPGLPAILVIFLQINTTST